MQGWGDTRGLGSGECERGTRGGNREEEGLRGLKIKALKGVPSRPSSSQAFMALKDLNPCSPGFTL